MATAVVFPGQGSQRPGMARPWSSVSSFARWSQADDVLGWDVSRLGTDADADELREPANCQIALFVHGVVLYEAWRERVGARAAVVAGHSLGEYNALVAARVLDFADGLRLVDIRARLTQAAAEEHPGTMVACLGYEPELVAEVCSAVGAHIANDNAPGQVVVAGSSERLEALRAHFADRPERGKVVDIDVGAAYHSPHMASAVPGLREAVDGSSFQTARVPVVANVDAAPHTAAFDWPELLTRQVIAPVRWRESVGTMVDGGVQEVVELCAAPVLTGLVKRIDRSMGRHAVTAPEDIDDLAAEVA